MKQISYSFRNKKVLVTGGASGVGYCIAKEFLRAGADVCIADLAPSKDLIGSFGIDNGNIMVIKTDVTDSESITHMITTIEAKYKTIDILINNASIYPVSNFLTLTEVEWDKMLSIDLKSVFLCTKVVSSLMIKKNNGGSIINIGSIDALHPSKGHSHYCSAKAGVHSFTLSSAQELGSYGIRVNTISPGLIDRPTLKEQWPDGYMRFTNKAPLGIIPSAKDIASACMFLSSDSAKCITGIDLPIDSGVLTSPPY